MFHFALSKRYRKIACSFYYCNYVAFKYHCSTQLQWNVTSYYFIYLLYFNVAWKIRMRFYNCVSLIFFFFCYFFVTCKLRNFRVIVRYFWNINYKILSIKYYINTTAAISTATALLLSLLLLISQLLLYLLLIYFYYTWPSSQRKQCKLYYR